MNELPKRENVDRETTKKIAFKLVFYYCIFSTIYFVVSDYLIALYVSNINLVDEITIAKDLAYITISAVLLYFLVHKQHEAKIKLLGSQEEAIEEKLQVKSLLESIAAHSSDAIFAKNLEGKYLLFNRGAEIAIGKNSADVIGQDDTFLFPPEQAAKIMQNDNQVIVENKIISSIEQVATIDDVKVYHATKGPLYDINGKIIGMFGISRDVTEWKTAERLLEEKNQLLTEMSKMAKIGGWEFDLVTRTGSWTDEIARIHDMTDTENITVESGLDVFHGNNRKVIETAIARAINQQQPYDLELEMVTAIGNRKFVRTVGIPVIENNKTISLHGFMQDISEQKFTEQNLRMWGAAFDHASFGLSISDVKTNKFLSVNPTFAKQRGYTVEEMIGMPIMKIFPPEVHEDVKNQISQMQLEGHGIRESVHIRKNGTTFPVLIDVTINKSLNGDPITRLAYVMDISERKQSEDIIYHLANYDGITNLPNRSLLIERIEQKSAFFRKNDSNIIALLNIDNFKSFNDVRGHNCGDFLLKEISERLMPFISEGDTLARVSGDEFAILLQAPNKMTNNTEVHTKRIKKINTELRRPFHIADEEIHITVSFGITSFPKNKKDNAESVLQRADTALLKAKKSGGNQIVFFDSAMRELAEQYFDMNKELHKAIAGNELRLYLQSQVDALGNLNGVEALVRWQHPTRGLIAPDSFIPIAEDSDLIIEIDNWVLNEVCHTLTNRAITDRHFRIAVNISPRHFKQDDFVDSIKKILSLNDTNPARITFEVTENLIIADINDVVTKMKALVAIGIRISIDDFGTGYSSLSYLKKLPIQELKIDRVFIQEAPSDPDDAAIVETIFAIARQLKLELVAEGVETFEQAQFLNAFGAVTHQGYLYGKPEPADDWLNKLS